MVLALEAAVVCQHSLEKVVAGLQIPEKVAAVRLWVVGGGKFVFAAFGRPRLQCRAPPGVLEKNGKDVSLETFHSDLGCLFRLGVRLEHKRTSGVALKQRRPKKSRELAIIDTE